MSDACSYDADDGPASGCEPTANGRLVCFGVDFRGRPRNAPAGPARKRGAVVG